MFRRLHPLLAFLLVLRFAGSFGPTPQTAAQDEVGRDEDVAYGDVDGVLLLLDVYRPPARDAPRPAVVLLHAFSRDRASMAPAAQAMVEAGYVAFNVEYRFSTTEQRNRWSAAFDDAQRAVRWVRSNADRYGVDPERLCAYGHSLGGQLAALLGVRETRDNGDSALAAYSSRVACVIDLAGTVDLTSPTLPAVDKAIYAAWLGGTPAEAPEAYRDVSPLFHVDGRSARFLIVQGGRDEAEQVEQSRRLVAALQAAGVDVVYAEFAAADHDVVGDWFLVGPLTMAFLALPRFG